MLNYPQRISLCGFGGQGIILSAVILGTAAVTRGNLYAVQTQSYGSEARGGQCQAELIIDREKINSPAFQCLRQNGMIGIRNRFNNNSPCIKPGVGINVHKNSHKLGNTQSGMRIVNMNSYSIFKSFK